MRKLFSILLIIWSAVGIVMAETGLRGTIVKAGDASPLQGVVVTLGNQDISTTTNANGEFSLLYLEPQDEELMIEAPGYISSIEIVQIIAGQVTDLGAISLQPDIANDAQEETLLNLTDGDLNDDEGKSQSMTSATSATQDVFNSTVAFAWGSTRYRTRGYDNTADVVYINGLSFNGAERGSFSYSSLGGLNDASRNKEVNNAIEANNFTFGGISSSTNILMNASRFAQGWKVGIAGTNRNYKGRVNATYASGPLSNGWSFVGQVAFRYSPYINIKGIIGEGSNYNSLGYFFSAEKVWEKGHKLSLLTFGSPTERGQSGAVTQEVYDLTGSINYNPYWGYQNGKIRNSRIVKSFDPTLIVSYEWTINPTSGLKAAAGFHYNLYSNSALSFYNAPDPRPDYYRNLPSFLYDGQFDKDGKLIVQDNTAFQNPLGTIQADGTLVPIDYNGQPVGRTMDYATFKNLTDLWRSRDNKTTQIDWDGLYAANYANNAVNPQGSARYIVERRHNNLAEAIFNVNYHKNWNHLRLTTGLDVRHSDGLHYKTIDDLIGANQWIDVDPFAERDIKELATNIGMTQRDIEQVKQNDIMNPSAKVLDNGKHFGYDYRIAMENASAWIQNEWTFNEVDLYYALKFDYNSMQRYTHMINGRAWYLSYLHPEKTSRYIGPKYTLANIQAQDAYDGANHYFFDPAFKAGITYKINGRNRLKLNAIAQTKAPLARDAYVSPRVHDYVIENIYTHDAAKNLKDFYAASEKIVGGDLTYEFNYPVVRGRITGFFTQFWDGSEMNGYYDDEARTFVNQAITGIERRHMGAEAAAAFKLGKYFTLTGALNIANYKYTNNAYSITSAENGMALAETKDGALFELRDSVLIKGLRVASGPQLNSSLKLSFFHPKMWFADITVTYADWNYLDYAPSRRMMGLYTDVRADGSTVNGSYADADALTGETNAYGIPVLKYPYNMLAAQESLSSSNAWYRFMIDVSVGKLIYLKNRQSLSINLSVSNLTNNTHFKTGGYQQARLPRATKQGVTDKTQNSVLTTNVWKFPSKYYYAWGANFFLNVTYKF